MGYFLTISDADVASLVGEIHKEISADEEKRTIRMNRRQTLEDVLFLAEINLTLVVANVAITLPTESRVAVLDFHQSLAKVPDLTHDSLLEQLSLISDTTVNTHLSQFEDGVEGKINKWMETEGKSIPEEERSGVIKDILLNQCKLIEKRIQDKSESNSMITNLFRFKSLAVLYNFVGRMGENI
ncbi:MAG: hypothetical protein WCO33_04565 [bacterium]